MSASNPVKMSPALVAAYQTEGITKASLQGVFAMLAMFVGVLMIQSPDVVKELTWLNDLIRGLLLPFGFYVIVSLPAIFAVHRIIQLNGILTSFGRPTFVTTRLVVGEPVPSKHPLLVVLISIIVVSVVSWTVLAQGFPVNLGNAFLLIGLHALVWAASRHVLIKAKSQKW